MRQERKSREFWESAVEFVTASELTQAQCAQKLGVSQPALNYWLRKLRQKPRTHLQGNLVPVKVLHSEAGKRHELELDLEKGCLRFTEQASPEYVALLVRTLRQC